MDQRDCKEDLYLLNLRIQIYQCEVTQLRKELGDLRQEFSRFQGNVSDQLRDKFFLPLLRSALQPGEEFTDKPADPLSLVGFDAKVVRSNLHKHLTSF